MMMHAFLQVFVVLLTVLLVACAPDPKYVRAVNTYADGSNRNYLCGFGRDALPGIIKSGARRMMKWSPPLRGSTLKAQLEKPLRDRNILTHDAKYSINDVCAESYLLMYSNDIKRLPKKMTKKDIADWVRRQMTNMGEKDPSIIEHFVEKTKTYHYLVHNASPHEFDPSPQLGSGGATSSGRTSSAGFGAGFGCFG